jgi:hypothetical protein
VKVPKSNISNVTTTSSKVVVVTNPGAPSSVVLPLTANTTETTTTPVTSPRKSTRISLRREPEGDTKTEKEGGSPSTGFVGAVHPGIVQPGFVGAVHPGIVQPEHAGVGRGRGRGRKSLIPDETPTSIRYTYSAGLNAECRGVYVLQLSDRCVLSEYDLGFYISEFIL